MVRLFLGGVHGQRVQQGTGNGDGGSNDRSGAHWCLEGNNGSDDDDNTLDSVSDGVCDRVDLSEGQEGNLVVGVVGGTSESEKDGEGLLGEVTGRDNVLEGTEEAGSLNGQHHGDQDKSGHGGQDSVKVLCVKVLSDGLSGHGLLGENSTGRGGDVGKHSRGKSKDGEGKLLHGSNGNSSNDGEKSQVNRQRKNLSEEEVVHQAGDNRFRGLDNVGEGDSSGSEGDDGTDVDTSMAKGNREESLEVGHAQLRSLAKLEKPHRDEVEDTGGHLDGGDGPWVAKDVEGLLVVDIVGNVEKVPQGEVGTDLKSFGQTTSGGFGILGSSRRHLESSSLAPGFKIEKVQFIQQDRISNGEENHHRKWETKNSPLAFYNQKIDASCNLQALNEASQHLLNRGRLEYLLGGNSGLLSDASLGGSHGSGGEGISLGEGACRARHGDGNGESDQSSLGKHG